MGATALVDMQRTGPGAKKKTTEAQPPKERSGMNKKTQHGHNQEVPHQREMTARQAEGPLPALPSVPGPPSPSAGSLFTCMHLSLGCCSEAL